MSTPRFFGVLFLILSSFVSLSDHEDITDANLNNPVERFPVLSPLRKPELESSVQRDRAASICEGAEDWNTAVERLYLAPTIDRTFYLNVGLGLPPQFFRLIVQTATDDIWVRECNPRELECYGPSAYRSEDSYSFRDIGKGFQKTYYPSAFVSGAEHEDDLVLGGTVARHQKFIGVSYCSDRSYLAGQYDGYFGLGLATPSFSQPPLPVFQNLLVQGAIYNPIFSIYLRKRGGGQLIIGGADPTHYIGEQHIWVPIKPQQDKWELFMGNVAMAHVTVRCDAGCSARIHSGIGHIAGPRLDIEAINEYLASFSIGDEDSRTMNWSGSCEKRVYNMAKAFFRRSNASTNPQILCLETGFCEEENESKIDLLEVYRNQGNANTTDAQLVTICDGCMAIANHIKTLRKLPMFKHKLSELICSSLAQSQNVEPLLNSDTIEVDCGSIEFFPYIAFKLGPRWFRLFPEDYTYRRVHRDYSLTCHSGFVPYDHPTEERWLLGTSFLRKFHTIFDIANRRIGLAVATT